MAPGPGLDAAEISAALDQLSRDPEVERMVLYGSCARGDARPGFDLDLLLILRGNLTRERELRLRQSARALLRPLLPVDFDLLIRDEATAQQSRPPERASAPAPPSPAPVSTAFRPCHRPTRSGHGYRAGSRQRLPLPPGHRREGIVVQEH